MKSCFRALFAQIFLINVSHAHKFSLQALDWAAPQGIDPSVCSIEHGKERTDAHFSPEQITLTTTSGLSVPALFFDRGSDVVLIVGQGLPGTKEDMLVYARLFSDYDVVLFDYRWSNNYEMFLLKSLLMCSPVQRVLLDEEEEVRAVIKFVEQRKSYKRVVALGDCYSNFLFAKIAARDIKRKSKSSFTHLILDSCFYSLRLLAERIAADPFLPIHPQEGGAPRVLKAITNNFVVRNLVLRCMFAFMKNVSIEKYLSVIDVPILFIHGTRDLFVPHDHFGLLWNATPSDKRAALFTPFRHSDNLQHKQLYKFTCERFIEGEGIGQFIDNCACLL